MTNATEQLTEIDLKAFEDAAKGYWFDDESEVITAKGFWRRAKLFYRENPRLLSGENLPPGAITSASAEIEKLSRFLGLELDENTKATLLVLWPLILDEKTREAQSKSDASMETLLRVASFLDIDLEKARSDEGKPSDVYIRHIHQFADKQVELSKKGGEPTKHPENLAAAEELGKAAYAQVKAYRSKKSSRWAMFKRIFGMS